MAKPAFCIDPMTPDDWPQVRAIYLEGIATGNATFETDAPSWDDWDRAHVAEPRLVARDTDGPVLGWVAVTPVSGRCVYAGVADLSVYVSAAARGRGIGRALLQALIDSSERTGIWTLQAASFPRTRRASRSIARAAFATWDAGSGSGRCTACGGTCSSSSGGAKAREPTDPGAARARGWGYFFPVRSLKTFRSGS